MARLTTFLTALPSELKSAIEFRHASWFDDEVCDALSARDVALCVGDDGVSTLPPRIGTTSWVYLRLRQPAYSDGALREWLDRATASGAGTGYAFFKHEDDGAGPALAARFLTLANAPSRAPKPPRSVPRASTPRGKTTQRQSNA
jgi:uncharacterized protein YecE (DUF72 family)